MRKLFHDKKGETLVEVMAAILIFTLSSIILYSMVTSASRVNKQADEWDKNLETQVAIVEMAQTVSDEGTVYLRKGTGAEPMKSITVELFKSAEGDELYSYKKKTVGTGP